MAELERLNFLIVESNQGMRSQLRSMLNSFGIANVKFAPSAGMAISRLRDRRYDVILSEYNLGDGQDGQHLLEDLRNKEIIPLDTLFIMITGERNYERVVSAAELVPNDYILKPLTPDMLHVRLLRALEKREIFQPVYRMIETGDTQQAIELCAARAESHPRYRTDFLRLEAEQHAALGHTEQAEAIYREILTARVVPWARLGLARMLFAKKDYAAAEEILSELVAENSRYVDAYDWLARTREETGRLKEARDVLASAVSLSPHRLKRLRHLGSVQFAAGDTAEAERTLAEVVRKGKYSDFRDPEDHVQLVRAQLSQGRTAEAQATIRDLESSMEGLSTTPACASLSKALYHTRTGSPELAQAALQDALQTGSALSALSLDMKQELVKACLDNHLEAAGSQLVIDILRNAADERTVEKTRAILRERGRSDLSNELEERVHVEVRALISAGAEMVKAGNFDGAVREMMAAVQKMPGNPHVLFNAALAVLRHIENRGWNERLAAQARGLIARTRRLDPTNPRLEALSGFMQQLVRKYAPRQGG
ncbi:tetratricopeptide repeat-containing response regulator [Azoarcus sp. DN11]|uniref:tetratricopeptide repeat-containing response regulator n=1 Tax=Azoarcus sp. DN11 TaxID=356837 RepID=UPI000EAECC4E|nr:tetratricopeptide repeat-containing response regulator [Azoarcus sp. DN11]AYH45188.1 response regulator [Azoarcus sp. DN11]